mgnify:CR=1 FL=1
MDIKSGPVPRVAPLFYEYIEYLGAGLVATSGIQYSAVVTFGTVAAEILNQLIDPGVDLGLRQLEIGFTQRFTERVGGTTTGSLVYYWEGREEWFERAGAVGTLRTGSWTALGATLAKGIASGANSEDSLAGFVPVTSIPHASVRVRLMGQALWANAFTGEVKNSSYVRMVGLVIPGA